MKLCWNVDLNMLHIHDLELFSEREKCLNFFLRWLKNSIFSKFCSHFPWAYFRVTLILQKYEFHKAYHLNFLHTPSPPPKKLQTVFRPNQRLFGRVDLAVYSRIFTKFPNSISLWFFEFFRRIGISSYEAQETDHNQKYLLFKIKIVDVMRDERLTKISVFLK